MIATMLVWLSQRRGRGATTLVVALMVLLARPAEALLSDPLQKDLGCPNLPAVATNYAPQANLDEFSYESDDGQGIDRSSAQLGHITAGLSEYLARTSGNARQVIVVHVHGGLVDRCRGYEDAASLIPLYREAGAYPIFPIYNVGLAESVDKGWSGQSARDEKRHGHPDSMPFATRYFYSHGLLADDVPDVRSWSMARRWPLLFLGARRARDHRDHRQPWTTAEQWLRYGPLPLLNEGLITGGRAWSYMKWSIDQSFAIDSGATVHPPKPAGLALISVLHAQVTPYAKARIVLVGHSTGAIWIAKFLRAWQCKYPKDPARFEIVFLAPAVRYDVLDKALREAGALIADGRMRTFTMADRYERDNREGPVPGLRALLYAPSLLYMVSGIFETDVDVPIFGLARFHEPDRARVESDATYPRDAPLASLASIASVENWFVEHGTVSPFVYSPSSGAALEGTRTSSCVHGEFPNEPDTRDSLTALVGGRGWTNAEVGGDGVCWQKKERNGRREQRRNEALGITQ